MNVFAKFDENPLMILQDIKEPKRYGHTHGRTDNVKTVYPPTNTVCGGYKKFYNFGIWLDAFQAGFLTMRLKRSENINMISTTVMTLSFRTDRSGQTVKTQIRLLLEEQSDQGPHCLLFPLHYFDKIT